MNKALLLLARASDFEAVRAFEYFHDRLVDGLTVSAVQIQQNIEKLATTDSHIEALASAIGEYSESTLNEVESVAVARYMLSLFAINESYTPIVADCVENWPDDRQTVGKILAVGVVGAVWMCIASTSVIYTNGDLEIHKDPFTSEQIIATTEFVAKPIVALSSLTEKALEEKSYRAISKKGCGDSESQN